jgi:hypothetical protein
MSTRSVTTLNRLYVAKLRALPGFPGVLINAARLLRPSKPESVSSHALWFIKHTQAVLVPLHSAPPSDRHSVYRSCFSSDSAEGFRNVERAFAATRRPRHCCKIGTGGEKWKIGFSNYPQAAPVQKIRRIRRKLRQCRNRRRHRTRVRTRSKQASHRARYPDGRRTPPTRVFRGVSRTSLETCAVSISQYGEVPHRRRPRQTTGLA